MVTLSRPQKSQIAEAILAAEKNTSGEIRVHLARGCRGEVMSEAKKVFVRLKMERTKRRNAVLIYTALDSRVFAIVGDSGIHERVGDDYWKKTRDLLTEYFSKGMITEGLIAAVASVGEKLKAHFPSSGPNADELPNTVTESS